MSHIALNRARSHGAGMTDAPTKNCRHCKQPIAIGASVCEHCGGKQTRGTALAVILGLLVIAVIGAVVAERFFPASENSAMDGEVRSNLDGAKALRDRIAASGVTRDARPLRDQRQAPLEFQGQTIGCARLVTAEGSYDRVIVAFDTPIYDGPTQGPWFGYLWDKVGC